MASTKALWCIAILLLSGCAGPATPASKSSGPGQTGVPTGSLTGTVVDDARLPLQGVEIQASNPEHEARTTTDEVGAFRFSALPAGTYEVAAALLGYEPASRRVDVRPGESNQTVFVLQSERTAQGPKQVKLAEDTYLACAFDLVVTTVTRHVCAFDSAHKSRARFDFARVGLYGIMQEVVWKNSLGVTANRMTVQLDLNLVCNAAGLCSVTRSYAARSGPSPVRLYTDVRGDAENFGTSPMPFYSAAAPNGDGKPAFSFQQRITHYVTGFYDGHGSLDTFSALPPAG